MKSMNYAAHRQPTSRAALATPPARGAGALRSLRSLRAEEWRVCRVRLGCRFARSQGYVPNRGCAPCAGDAVLLRRMLMLQPGFRPAARFRRIPRNQRLDTGSRRAGAIFSRFRPISPLGHWPLSAGVRRWRLLLARSRQRHNAERETKYFRRQMGSPVVLSH